MMCSFWILGFIFGFILVQSHQKKEKRSAFGYGSEYAHKYNRPSLMPVTCIRANQDVTDFMDFFYDGPRESGACCIIL
eukprot:UN07792